MYTRYSAAPKKFGRPSFASKAKHSRSTSKSGGPKKNFNNHNAPRKSANRRSGGFSGERIDFARFVKRAEKVEEKPYVAKHTFADFPFSAQLHQNIAARGYITPMPIQDQSIQAIIDGRDVFGLANTGTGKTAAFLLPLIDRISKNRKDKVLILAPTRELALQIEDELYAFQKGMKIYSALVVGGMPIGRQISEIKNGVSFVVGTPGRVRDLMDRGVLDLSGYTTVVLDEADRMLDMGFHDEMVFIIGKMNAIRQTLFFSATLSPEIRKLTERFLKNPLFISVVMADTSKNVDQDVIRVKDKDAKIEQLHEVLNKEDTEKVLIFRETKRSVDQLERELAKRGFKVGGIHGDKRNRERVRTLDSFKSNQINILVATDVAARGLDIPNVTHVINYDIPNDYETYVHRIGRTGRADKKGTALTFIPGR